MFIACIKSSIESAIELKWNAEYGKRAKMCPFVSYSIYEYWNQFIKFTIRSHTANVLSLRNAHRTLICFSSSAYCLFHHAAIFCSFKFIYSMNNFSCVLSIYYFMVMLGYRFVFFSLFLYFAYLVDESRIFIFEILCLFQSYQLRHRSWIYMWWINQQ